MGPTLVEVFKEYGAEVIVDDQTLVNAGAIANLIDYAGHVDILIANLAVPAPSTTVLDSDEEEWRYVFEHIVDPLPILIRANTRRFAAYLCSDAAACFVGQVFPICGGWVQR